MEENSKKRKNHKYRVLNKAVLRTKEIKVRCNSEEYKKIAKNAKKQGLAVAVYLREQGLIEKTKGSKANAEILKQIAKIGNNINQIARKVNTKNTVDIATLKNILDKQIELVKLLTDI